MRASPLAPLLGVLALSLPAAVRAGGHMESGLWEVSVTVELPGVASPPPTVQTECLSQADVDADPVPQLDKSACKATDIHRSGDKIVWKLDCGPIGKGDGEVVYQSPTAYEGSMKLETGGTVVRSKIRAKRVGGC